MYEPEHNRTLVVALAPKQTIDIKEEYEKRLDWIKDVEGMKDEYEEWLAGDLEDNLLKFALQHFGQEIFFLDHEGQRFKYGDSIDYKFNKHLKSKYHFEQTTIGSRNFLVQIRKKTLQTIDGRKRTRDGQCNDKLIRHPSEDGWNLPIEHDRHFNKFPQEVQDLIMQFVVSVEYPETIKPLVVTSNWKTHWHARCYEEHGFGRSLAFLPRKDAEGPYTEVCEVWRASIDATSLRVNRKFFDAGNHLLYSKNTFRFGTGRNDKDIYAAPPSTYDGVHLHRPPSEKPELTNLELGYDDPLFAKAITSISTQLKESRLAGWIYYDPFLRFLHNIGPRNASYIKALKFSSGDPPSRRGYDDSHYCWKMGAHDFVNGLKMYMPFIKAICPNLRRLIIQVDKDCEYCAAQNDLSVQPTGQAEEVLLPFLENELRTLTSLDKLVVYDTDYDDPVYWAIETAQWVTKQAEERHKLEWIEEKEELKRIQDEKRMEAVANIRCEFCGEAHIWAECYNLCPLCGEYGHDRETCPWFGNWGV